VVIGVCVVGVGGDSGAWLRGEVGWIVRSGEEGGLQGGESAGWGGGAQAAEVGSCPDKRTRVSDEVLGCSWGV
jgi:hypothetical protein